MLSNLKILLIGIAITASHTAKLDAPKKKRHERILRKMDKKTLKKKLTPLQYHVTQEGGTEKPFDNKYWDHKETGIYVDVVTGEALFSSQDKFDSNSGWPSFTQPIKQTSVKTKDDFKLFMKRTEVLSKDGGSHLGHVFDDGPGPSKKRYCINSAALKFIPVTKLVEEGYSEFLPLFSKSPVNKGKEFKEASHRKSVAEKTKEEAIFAGGCFWCVEAAFDKVPGVLQTISGYIGGFKKNPTYEEVIRGNTGHVEAVKLIYDPEMISYRDLLSFFWMNIDPTNKKGQFCDIGPQYVTVIFSLTPEQKKIALKSRDEHVKNLGLESLQIVTEIQDGSKLAFYKAEEYHQGYHIKNPLRYKMYYNQCGREKSLQSIWKKDVREKLMNKYSGK